MSEFEDIHVGDVWDAKDNQTFPGDFSLDEAEFASELRDLFGPEREDLPPLFTQTLLENARVAAPGPGFEQKTAYRVFRRLSLARSPLASRPQHGSRPQVASSWRAMRGAPKSLTLSFGLLMVFMVFTMVLASPAFGAGMRILLGKTGVEQVHGYPAHVRASPTHTNSRGKNAISNDTPIYWLGSSAGNYSYLTTQLLDPTEWSRGPIVDVQYTLTQPGGGTGFLDIREFQVNSQYAAVLQVVQDGSTQLVQVGNSSAVYVDGTWMLVPVRERSAMSSSMDPTAAATSYTWESGIRSELILERGGVVLWIVGDQRDGANADTLTSLAQNLTLTSYSQLASRWPGRLRFVDEALIQSFQEPDGRELYDLVKAGTSPESSSGVYEQSQP